MKLQEAMDIIHNKPKGFRVIFAWDDGDFLRHDHFPELDEPLIPTEGQASDLATRFARVTVGETHNVAVIDENSELVPKYEKSKLNPCKAGSTLYVHDKTKQLGTKKKETGRAAP